MDEKVKTDEKIKEVDKKLRIEMRDSAMQSLKILFANVQNIPATAAEHHELQKHFQIVQKILDDLS